MSEKADPKTTLGPGALTADRASSVETVPRRVSDEFKRLADRSRDVVYRYDLLERRYVFWNKVGLLTYGEHGGVEYPTSSTVIEMVLPEDRDRVRHVAKASLKSKRMKGEVEYRIRLSDGSIRHMHDRWIVIRDDNDRPVAIEGVVRDTTEAKKILEELHESRESYRRLVETMNDGLVAADREERFTYVNQRFCRMLGYAQEMLVGSAISDYISGEDQPTFLRQSSKRSSGVRDPYEISWVARTGRRIPTIVSPEPIFDAGGAFEGSFAVVTDISEQKRAQTALEEREKELEANKRHLEDVIRALSTLLDKRDLDRTKFHNALEQHVRGNVEPYLEKLKQTDLTEHQRVLVSIVESGYKEFVTPGSGSEVERSGRLSAAETQVAKLVKIGKSTKEIAEVLNLSPRTVESHRYNIRKKLGIRHSGQQLRTRLVRAGEARSGKGRDWLTEPSGEGAPHTQDPRRYP